MSSLTALHRFYRQGMYLEALNLIKKAEDNHSIPMEEKLEFKLIKSKIYFKKGKFDVSWDILRNIELQVSQQPSSPLYIKCLLLEIDHLLQKGLISDARERLNKSRGLLESLKNSLSQMEFLDFNARICLKSAKIEMNSGNVNAALENLKKTEEFAQRLHNFQLLGMTYYSRSSIYRKRGELAKALEYIEKAETMFQKVGNKISLAECLDSKGIIKAQKGDLKEALSLFLQALPIFQEERLLGPIARLLMHIGNVYRIMGDLEKSIEYYEGSLKLFKKLHDKVMVATCLMNIGTNYGQNGDLTNALESFLAAKKIITGDEGKRTLGIILMNIGNVYSQKGELTTALSYYHKGLVLFQDLGMKIYEGQCLLNIGIVYQMKGEEKRALSWFLKSYELFKKTQSIFHLGEALYSIIVTLVDEGEISQAKEYLDEFEAISKAEESKVLSQLYRLSKAVVMKGEPRLKLKFRALDILERLADEKVTENKIVTDAILHLLDLLAKELELTGNREILNEIFAWLNSLERLAEKTKSYWILAEIYVFRAKLFFLDFEFHDAQRLLAQAQHIAEKHDLKKLSEKIMRETEDFLALMDDLQISPHDELTLAEQIRIAGINSHLRRILYRQLDTTEQAASLIVPHNLLIISKNGPLIYEYRFYESNLGAQMKSDIISGLLSAVKSMSDEIFGYEGNIEYIKHQENVIVFKAVDSFIFCFIFSGILYIGIQALNRLITTLYPNKMLWNMLIDVLYGRLPALPSDVQAQLNEAVIQALNRYLPTE